MSIRSKLAIAALLTAISAPAFAGDQDSAALAVSDGRYVATSLDGVYASANGNIHASARRNAVTGGDFQLGGR